VGFFQAIFFSILILTKKKKYLKDYILAAFIVLFGMQLLFIFSIESGNYSKYPFLVLSDFIYWTILGPLLYIYVELSIHHKNKLDWKSLIHLLPLIIVLSAHADYIIHYLYKVDITSYSNNRVKNPFIIFGEYVFAFTNLFYFFLIIIKIKKHNKTIPDFFSNTKGVDLKLLNYLTYGFAIYTLLEVFIILYGEKINVNALHYLMSFSWIVLNLYIFGIGYIGYKQQSIFSDFPENFTPLIFKKEIVEGNNMIYSDAHSSHNKKKYYKSRLDTQEKEYLLEELISYMKNEKPYLNPELNLKILSDHLNTTPHKLSQVINDALGKNFFDFINEYRVEEMKKILLSPDNQKYSITPLAYDCGFNSTSAFYTIFKKQTATTPAEFRKMHVPVEA